MLAYYQRYNDVDDDDDYECNNANDDDYMSDWYEPHQTETPPPTPPKVSSDMRRIVFPSPSPDVVWGYLSPKNPKCPYRSWYLIGPKNTYKLGASHYMDFCVTGSSIDAAHHCTIFWDGTNSEYAVHVVDYTEEVIGGNWGGTFINDVRLLPRIPSLLRPGDSIQFIGEDPMGTNEDLR
ncbi:uncharacterized protein FIBRA_05969 [Fibroporia radiculosa]|uniref:FHA domain-containing protein n=1 Tax=Fibroporia radiculosa TaxID=599839 RepID=J4GRY3_9APHY|nr:uncharacterized protein FIBRA_05969 [Fibroporia radiculosa]CCM03820.1 predicted protein [Fibroporia radiculosa]